MARLLPTSTDASPVREGDPSVLCIEDDRIDEVFSVLSTDMARTIFRELNRSALTASEIADTHDTSIQNVSYHLENLEESGLISVVDTCYSEKGREMSVYAVTTEPTIVFLGTNEDLPRLRKAFREFSTVIGPVSVVFALLGSTGRFVENLFGASG